MALRMKALLLGSLLRNSASSASTLKATTSVLACLRDMPRVSGGREGLHHCTADGRGEQAAGGVTQGHSLFHNGACVAGAERSEAPGGEKGCLVRGFAALSPGHTLRPTE